MSRSMKPLPNVELQDAFCIRELHGFDGELIVGDYCAKDAFNLTTSVLMSRFKRIPVLTYYVFDDFSFSGLYYARLESLRSRVAALNLHWIKVLEQKTFYEVDGLAYYEEQAVQLGYEGLMVRGGNGIYKQGRSTLKEQYLMKLKRFKDAEAKCVGYTELKRNENEPTTSETGYQVRSSHKDNMIGGSVVGALTCVWEATGETFNVGTGFSALDRKHLWSIRDSLAGRTVKFKYQDYGVKDLPRIPVFVGFRSEEDM